MGGKLTSGLSQETRDLLRQNSNFFEAVTKLGEKTGAKVQGKDAEARTEVEVQADGNVAVSFVFPVDDNNQGGDGRIYLRDTFVYDPSQKKLNGYKRDFQYNGRGEDKEGWQKRLAAYRSAALPDDEKLQTFAYQVARTFSRPFSTDHLAIFSKNKAAHFGPLIEATQAEGLRLRVKDPRSHYAVFHRGLTTEVIFSYVLDDPEGKKSGHLVVQDKFVFNGNTGQVVGYDRTTKPGAGSPESEGWTELAQKVDAIEKPSAEIAKTFIQSFMPGLLTEIPTAASASAEAVPPPGGYAEYSDALFRKTMNSVVRSKKAVPLAEMEPHFFEGLAAAESYFAPLKESLGTDFPLNLKDPPIEVSTSVEGGKSYVVLKFSFRPQGGEGQGILDYTERWTFEHGFPTKIERRAQAFGAPEGGAVDRVAKKINEDIAAEKYPPLANKEGKLDKRTDQVMMGTLPFIAPQLAYMGYSKMLDHPQLGYEQRMALEVIDAARLSLEPLLHLNGIDSTYRTRVLRMLAGMSFGDLQTAGMAAQELEASETAALKVATSPEAKQRHEDNLRLVHTVYALNSDDLDRARDLIKGFHSPAFKRAFEKPLQPFFARRRSMEGLGVMSKVAEDQISLRVRDSKAWSYKGPKVDPEAEKKVVETLFQKSLAQVTQSKSSDAIAVLRELSEIGKGKKVEEYNEVEKKLALSPEERALAERVMQDTLMIELASIAQDDMKDIQAQKYMGIAQEKLFDKGMVGAARWLTQMVATDKLPKSRSSESLDILRIMAFEKIDLSHPVDKLPSLQPTVPPGFKAFDSLYNKVGEKSGIDPKKSVLVLLKEAADLQGDEANLRDYFLKLPSLQKLDEASKLPTVAERVKVYRELLAPLMKLNAQDPKTIQIKNGVEKFLNQIELQSQDEAPAAEGVLLLETLPILDMAVETEKKIQEHLKVAEAHDKDMKAASTLLNKATLAATQRPDETAFSVLKSLPDADLNEDEKRIRTQILEDKNLEKLTGVAAEAAMEKRVEAYGKLIQDPELAKAGYTKTTEWLRQMLLTGKLPDPAAYHPPLQEGQVKPAGQEQAEKLERNVRKFLALTEGKGDFGSKFEVGFKHFSKEVSKPTTLAAMTLAPIVGSGLELYGLWRFRNLGAFGRFLGSSIGVVGEAGAFTYSSKAMDSYVYTSEGVWENHAGDFKSNILMFGAMRGAHTTSAALSQRFLATGPRGFKWAGGYVAGEAGAAGIVKTPTGRLVNVGKAAGPGVPQLSVNGKRFATLLDHGFAVGSMHLAGKANHKLGWSKHDGTFSDTLLMYVQAMAGFRLANGLTGGHLQLGMMGMRMRIDSVKARSEITEMQAKIDAAKKDGKTSKDLIEAYERELQRLLEVEQKDGKKEPEAPEMPADLLRLFDPKVETLDPLAKELAATPREHQMSLARAIAKVKDPAGLFKMLRESPYQGGAEIFGAVAEVFSGRRPLESLPKEMGIQGKVKSLLETQVAELKKSGLSLDPTTQVKDGFIDPRLSPLEAEFQTLKAMEALKLRVSRASNLAEALEILGQSSFQQIEGVKTKDIFDWLGHEQLKAVAEQAKKSETALREKITIGEKRLKVEEGKKRPDKTLVTELKQKLEDWKAKAEKSQELHGTIEQVLEAHQKGQEQAKAETDLAKLVERLPAALGIRQKGRDAVEQAKGDFAEGLSKKKKDVTIAVVKKYLDVQAKDDFNAAQNTLRQAIDAASPLAQLMLRRATEAEMAVLLEVYLGKSEFRDLPAAQAFQVATLLGQARIKGELGLMQNLNAVGETLRLVRGDLDAHAKASVEEALVLRTHPASKDGQQLVFNKDDILGLAKQAKQVFATSGNLSHPNRGASDQAFAGQHSDTQVFFDPATLSFQTWVVHTKGLSKVKVTLDAKGEVEKFEIKYAAKPEAAGKGKTDLLAPTKLEGLKGAGDETIPVDAVRVDYEALLKEFPFEVPTVGRVARAFDFVARGTDKIPSLPKLPKFGKGTKTEAKAETKPEAKDPKDPPADGSASAKKSDTDASLASGLIGFFRGDRSNPVIAFFRGALGLSAKDAKAKTEVAAKPEAPVEDPSVITPPAMPPKADGSRPTLPEGIQFPGPKVAMGEVGTVESPAGLEFHFKKNPVMGEVYGKTHEGVGRQENQDGASVTYTPERDLVVVAADGMGGHFGGKEAARILLETFTEQVAQGKGVEEASQAANKNVVDQLYNPELGNRQPGAGVVILKVNRPEVHGAPHTMEAFWGSDLKLTLYRQAKDGHGSWVYSTLPDNYGRQIVDAMKEFGPKGEGRDLHTNANPRGNSVSNTVGTLNFRLHSTAEGEIFDSQTGFKPAQGLEKIALKDGDVAIAGSDGLWKNIPDRNLAYEWTKDAKTAKEKAEILDAKVRERMKVMAEAEAKFEKGEISRDERMPFQLEGKDLFIDENGNVYDQAKGGKLVDHYEADNFSVFVYVHDTKGAPDTARVDSTPPASPKAEPGEGEIRPPSDTELSDPDKTSIWQRPEAPKDKPADETGSKGESTPPVDPDKEQ